MQAFVELSALNEMIIHIYLYIYNVTFLNKHKRILQTFPVLRRSKGGYIERLTKASLLTSL